MPTCYDQIQKHTASETSDNFLSHDPTGQNTVHNPQNSHNRLSLKHIVTLKLILFSFKIDNFQTTFHKRITTKITPINLRQFFRGMI